MEDFVVNFKVDNVLRHEVVKAVDQRQAEEEIMRSHGGAFIMNSVPFSELPELRTRKGLASNSEILESFLLNKFEALTFQAVDFSSNSDSFFTRLDLRFKSASQAKILSFTDSRYFSKAALTNFINQLERNGVDVEFNASTHPKHIWITIADDEEFESEVNRLLNLDSPIEGLGRDLQNL